MKVDEIIFALDVPNAGLAKPHIDNLAKRVGCFKVGLELYSGPEGIQVINSVKKAGGQFFADLKLHDIPETVMRAAYNAAHMGARYITAHALGGKKMLKYAVQGAAAGSIAAREDLVRAGEDPSTIKDADILAITILTSHDVETLIEVGLLQPEAILGSEEDQQGWITHTTLNLTRLAKSAGCQGVVSSPREVAEIRKHLGNDLRIITPGIRMTGADAQDQARAGTAYKAIHDGATALVIGRPIRDAANQHQVIDAFAAEISAARHPQT